MCYSLHSVVTSMRVARIPVHNTKSRAKARFFGGKRKSRHTLATHVSGLNYVTLRQKNVFLYAQQGELTSLLRPLPLEISPLVQLIINEGFASVKSLAVRFFNEIMF